MHTIAFLMPWLRKIGKYKLDGVISQIIWMH